MLWVQGRALCACLRFGYKQMIRLYKRREWCTRHQQGPHLAGADHDWAGDRTELHFAAPSVSKGDGRTAAAYPTGLGAAELHR
jgi:hypothetical protein